MMTKEKGWIKIIQSAAGQYNNIRSIDKKIILGDLHDLMFIRLSYGSMAGLIFVAGSDHKFLVARTLLISSVEMIFQI